ncbi:hypothetical protein F5J12DRAFT_324504 [Pisolithus orientalis]|uniref:uncharacterized protein n=1 Tax=Pisolithus orientalis TaxID=936130 RepID=UPI002224F53F|nr:uncharacterized protein F5J12DRAFT_324504 [Pisolithus orientalis]KAI5998379.1 hypothetical protein F5J12DRAFT_324504 [Pisolithus orientalis]
MTDFQVLGTIAQWLNAVYNKNIKLSVILYFHRISDHRISACIITSSPHRPGSHFLS